MSPVLFNSISDGAIYAHTHYEGTNRGILIGNIGIRVAVFLPSRYLTVKFNKWKTSLVSEHFTTCATINFKTPTNTYYAATL